MEAKNYQQENEMDTTSNLSTWALRQTNEKREAMRIEPGRFGDFAYDWHPSRYEWDVVYYNGADEAVVATVRVDYSTGEVYFISNLWLTTDELKDIVRFMEYERTNPEE